MEIKSILILISLMQVKALTMQPLYEELYSSDNSAYYLTDVETGNVTCCGNFIKIEGYLATINSVTFNKCINSHDMSVSCNSDNKMHQSIIRSKCPKYFTQVENGCVINNDIRVENDIGAGLCDQEIECFEYVHKNEKLLGCKGMESAKPMDLKEYNNLHAIASKEGIYWNDKTGPFIRKIKTLACRLVSGINFIHAKIKDDMVIIKLHSDVMNNCKFLFNGKSDHFTCQGDCEKHVKYDWLEGDSIKRKATIMCGEWVKPFWLFRTQNSEKIPSILHTRSKWSTVSQTAFSAFLYILVLGYPTIRILLGLLFVFVHIYNTFITNGYKYIMQHFLGFANDSEHICNYCKNTIENIADFELHEETCHKEKCPYCFKRIVKELMSNHVFNCMQKMVKISEREEKIQLEIDEERRALKSSLSSIWRNRWSREKLPTQIWIMILFVSFIFIFITPSSALEMPCNRIMGETHNCFSKDSGSDNPEDHFKWSRVEMSMLDKLEAKFEGNMYQRNSINRLKIESKMFSDASSSKSIDYTVNHCDANDLKCKASGEITWADSVIDGNIQEYTIDSNSHHSTSVHLMITGVELDVEMDLMYYTTAWKLEPINAFSCSESNCEKVCTEDMTSCQLKSFSRSKDSSWAHNPIYCLSISSGCTCVNIKFEKMRNSPFLAVYKKKKSYMKAVFCIEENSEFIDCEIVDNVGTYDLHNNKLIIETWQIEKSIPEIIAVPIYPGDNKNITEVYTGNFCAKNNCKMGSLGDIQFSRPLFNCSDKSFYISNMDGIKADLVYSFATTPRWNIYSPRSGMQNNKMDTIENMPHLKDAHYNFSNGMLSFTNGYMGRFVAKAEIVDVTIYNIDEDFKVDTFKILNCMGRYGTENAAICTYEICINGKYGTVRFLSDSNKFVQDDHQSLKSGCNIIRKPMYVRSITHDFKMCLRIKNQDDKCTSSPFNFTEPEVKVSLHYGFEMTHYSDTIDKKCDSWLDIRCIPKKFFDFMSLVYKDILYIIIGVTLVAAGLIVIHLLKCSKKEGKLVVDGRKLSRLSKLSKYKRLGYSVDKYN